MKRIRWGIAFLFFLPVILGMSTGCAASISKMERDVSKQEEKTVDKENKKGIEMEKCNLTEMEKKLLVDVFGEEERFEEGNLFSYQKEALDQLRAAEAYLAERYPEHEFQYLSLDPANRFRPWAEISIKEKESPVCLAKVSPAGESGKNVCEDNFYGYLIEKEYDRRIEEILEREGFHIRAYTVFISTIGSEFEPEGTVDDLLAYNRKLTRNTDLFISGADVDENVKTAVQKKLLDEGMYGSYRLYFTDNSVEREIALIEQDKSQWKSLTFNCFNIE